MAGNKLMAMLVTIAIGLGILEWWSVNELYGTDKLAGPLMGAAIFATFAGIPYFERKLGAQWHQAVIAALRAVLELLFCVVALSSISTIAVVLMPISLTSRFMQGDSATDFILFVMLTFSLVVAARAWAKYTKEALRASNAELEAERAKLLIAEQDKELARAELAVLRAQIEPHFLWNTLAHIQLLARKRPEDAEKMTGHLIRFLRSAVPQTNGNMSTLGEELGSVDAYLNLMKIRMGARLSISVDFDKGLSQIPFPTRVIHTLVENAIKHGIEPKVGDAFIKVSARVEIEGSNRLIVEVADNGIGLQDSPETQGTGLGLRSVRERLRLLYGPDAKLVVSSAIGGGVISRVELPPQAPFL